MLVSESDSSPGGVTSVDLTLTSDDVDDSETEDLTRLRIGSTLFVSGSPRLGWRQTDQKLHARRTVYKYYSQLPGP